MLIILLIMRTRGETSGCVASILLLNLFVSWGISSAGTNSVSVPAEDVDSRTIFVNNVHF